MGKLDYLSKYTSNDDYDGGGDNDDGSRKRKKKKKKSKKSKKKKTIDDTFIREYDDEFDTARFGAANGNGGNDDGHEDDDDEEEEGPVVVETVVEKQRLDYEKQGFREVVETGVSNALNQQKKQPRRQRYDSDHSQEETPTTTRKRYDSEDEGDKQSHSKYQSDDNNPTALPSRRQNYSDNDDESLSPSNKKKRYDSDDQDEHQESPVRNKRRRDSPNVAHRPRKRYDSDDDENHASDSQPTRRKRYDSDSSDGSNLPKRRQRYDSDDDNDSDSRERMSSGHVAGLQQAADFRQAEQKLQREKHNAAQAMVDKHGMGDTIYRDEMGRQVEEPPPNKGKHNKVAVIQLSEQEKKDLHTGRTQKLEQENLEKQWRELKQSTFARSADDRRLEEIRKHELRHGDPMARYASSSSKKTQGGQNIVANQRRVYRGPQPKPNRFGIRPGYRWDGVDRGNGFEDRVLARKYSQQHKKEQAYRYSSADM